jgi:hypothetical protein
MVPHRLIPSRRGASAWGRRHPARSSAYRPRLEGLEGRLLLSPYTVTTAADSGPGSLREALLERASPITFDIGSGVQVIQPLSPLPTIAAAGTLIDGSTQPGFTGTPLIVLDGTFAGTSANGLVVSGGSCTIQDLVIDNFSHASRAGILLQGDGDVVRGNYLGTDVTGTRARGNTYGVLVQASDAVISGNLISGNTSDGVELRARQAQVVGNRIGTNAAGTQALANPVGVNLVDSSGPDVIGGTAPADRNLISGNTYYGVDVNSLAIAEVLGNYIGTDATGTAAVGNGDGIYATGTVTVGGTAPGAGNIISGNGDGIFDYGGMVVEGNFIGLNAAGTAALGNFNGIEFLNGGTVGGTVAGAGNVIAGNFADGILVDLGGAALVQGNLIGTNPAGTAVIPNGKDGLEINSSFTTVGGTAAAAGNLIAGNGQDGIALAGDSFAGNLVQGNTIGTNAAHTAALPNHRYGIAVNGMKNTIGGPTVAARNVIAGNTSDGVFFSADASVNLLQGNVIAQNGGNGLTIAAGATANVLKGNAIGTTPAGNLAYPNAGSGVSVLGASNTIGGTAAGAGNVIAGNTLDGVVLAGSFNLVQGNTLGANAAHTAALPNRAGLVVSGTNNTVGGIAAGAGNFIAGNAADGLDLSGGANLVQGNIVAANGGTGLTVTSANNTVGGTAAGAGNFVVLNARDGVLLSGSGASGNRVQGNFLGTGPSGTSALGNGGNGVAVVNASNNTIGGTAAGAGNTIAFNGNDGVLVDTGTGNAIQQNSIYSSGNLGIELRNGGNNNQAAPVLTAVTSDGSSTTIAGTLTNAPDTSFTVEFYANAVCNLSGFGEGQTFLGAATVTTDDSGTATFTVTLDGGVAAGQYVSATATDPAGNTSAFAACWQLPSTALPGLAALRTTGLANPLSPTSSPAPVSLAQRRADALFRTLGPEVRRPSPQESKSFAGASGLAAAPPTGAGEPGEVLGDLLGVPAWSDSRW